MVYIKTYTENATNRYLLEKMKNGTLSSTVMLMHCGLKI